MLLKPHDHCRSCKKPIVWAETEKGRRIPIDPEPVNDGNITLHERERFLPPLAIVRFSIPTGEGIRFKSHFVTCPQASKWRKTS
jgi:hypothetical protein